MRAPKLLLAFIIGFVPIQQSIAQDEDEDDGINIFEHISIDLKELQALSNSLTDRLVGENVRMSLEECITMALEGNQDITIVQFETSLSDADLKSARGVFDPVLTGTFLHIDAKSPASPTQALFSGGQLQTISNKLTDYQLSIGGKFFRWGTQYNMDYVLGRESGSFARNPVTGEGISTYSGGITTTITQPILRGRGTAVNRVQIDRARNSQHLSNAQIRLTAMNTIGETIKAYWDLVGAIQNLEVREESLENAMRLVNINEQRLEIGTAAAIEVLQAKAQAATRHSDVVTAKSNILDAEDILKNFLNMNEDDIFSTKSIVPTTSPGKVGLDWDLDKSIATALSNRPEIETAHYQIDNARLDERRTRNELLPQLDTSVAYGRSARDLQADHLIDGVAEPQGRSWTFSVIGSIPIGNRGAKGAHTRAKQFKRQQELRLAKTKRDIMLDVRRGIRGVVTSENLVESDKQARILQEANVAAEEKRLKLGVTTSQDVLDRQEDLTLAQTQELQSIVNYEKSLIQLQLAEGTLLQNLNIDVKTRR